MNVLIQIPLERMLFLVIAFGIFGYMHIQKSNQYEKLIAEKEYNEKSLTD